MPLLRLHVGTLADPWAMVELLPDVQALWMEVFPGSPQTLAVTKEPIFSIVCIVTTFVVFGY